jgi:arsenate reductase
VTQKPRVLFLCMHNAARSQIAETLLRQYAGHRFEVISAGLEPTEVHPLTRQVLEESGVDHGPLRAKGAREFLGRTSVHYAIIVCQRLEAQCPQIFPFAVQTLHWNFGDPTEPQGSAELQLAKFRRLRDEIDARIKAWLREGDAS